MTKLPMTPRIPVSKRFKASPSMILAGVPAILLVAGLATAQQTASNDKPDKPVLTLKAQVHEVVLPVTVRDKKGQLVSTLKQEDFVLTDDGRPQTVRSFAHGLNLPLRMGLLIDTSRSQSSALAGERSASGKFVDQMLSQPADKAFLIHFDHEVELLQDFTSSKDKLHHELDEMSASTSGGEERPENGAGSDDNEHANRHRGGTELYDAIYLAANDVMAKQPGRKAIIVFSDGADRGSRESLGEAIDAAEKANMSVYTIYFKGEEEHRSMQQGMGNHRGGMGGGGYPGGGGGGYPGGGGQGGHHGGGGGGNEVKVDGKKILEQIATRTGGRFFEAKKKDSFDEVYAQISEELRGQYLLTYSPDKPPVKDENTDGFRKISLKTKDESLQVITREGYFASADSD
jgi:VWFA-related protein